MPKLATLKPRLTEARAARVPTMQPGSWRTSAMTSTDMGYGVRWRAYRLGWLREHPLCGDRKHGPSVEHSLCLAQGRATPGIDVDHIRPHKGDQRLFWDDANHQSLCRSCHSLKTSKEQRAGI